MPNQKELQKEVQVHRSLIHDYILGFLHHELLPQEKEREGWVPGLYMLLELAVGGDLFDKIGKSSISPLRRCVDPGIIADSPAPDVGVPEDLAKFYFAQLASGIVS